MCECLGIGGRTLELEPPLGGGIHRGAAGGTDRGGPKNKALRQQSKGESGSFRVTGQACPEPGARKNR